MMHDSLLALIPAKGASTRLARKNALQLGGDSLVARAVKTATEAGVFSSVVVSTEDEAIAKIALEAGALVPFLRPHHLSKDPAGVVDVTLHALDYLETENGLSFKDVVILLPTSPFRTPGDIIEALRIYRERGVDFLMSVSSYDHTPLSALIEKDGFLNPLLPDLIGTSGAKSKGGLTIRRSNGAVTICNVARLRSERTYYAYPLAAYEMPVERSLDIDSEMDFAFAEFLLERQKT